MIRNMKVQTTLNLNQFEVWVKPNLSIDSGYFVELRIEGAIEDGRMCQLTDALSFGHITLQPLYPQDGYWTVQIPCEEWLDLMQRIPIDWSPFCDEYDDLPAEVEAMARKEMIDRATCPAILPRDHVMHKCSGCGQVFWTKNDDPRGIFGHCPGCNFKEARMKREQMNEYREVSA